MSTPRKEEILVVDDEASVLEVVTLYLEKEGFRVRQAHDGQEALAALAEQRPALVVLDLMLPQVDGLEIVRQLRDDEGSAIPIILLSARREEVDRIYGLRMGADDYVTKPFSPAELVERVRAVLRRVQASSSRSEEQPLDFGDLLIDPLSHRIRVRGEEVELTATEFNLLLFMARHPRQVFSRDQLLENVWGFSDYVDPSTVTVHIRRLREKIEVTPAEPCWLQTVWGVGYRFDPPAT